MTQEFQINGSTLYFEWVHVGQYNPYGDTHRVCDISWIGDQPSVAELLSAIESLYHINVPLRENWDPKDMSEYFKGYCTIAFEGNKYVYDKVEPYTD